MPPLVEYSWENLSKFKFTSESLEIILLMNSWEDIGNEIHTQH